MKHAGENAAQGRGKDILYSFLNRKHFAAVSVTRNHLTAYGVLIPRLSVFQALELRVHLFESGFSLPGSPAATFLLFSKDGQLFVPVIKKLFHFRLFVKSKKIRFPPL